MRNATLYPYFLKKSQRGRGLFEVMALGVGAY